MTDDELEKLRQQGDRPEPLFDRVCANPGCGEPLVRRLGESASNFTRRSSCGSRACVSALATMGGFRSAQVRIAKMPSLPDRHCPACGELLKRKLGEDTGKFRRRRSCGGECAAQLRREAAAKGAAARAEKLAPKGRRPAAQPRSRPVPSRSRSVDPRLIREEWEAQGQYGMTRESFARMLNVSRAQVDQALGVAS